MIANEPTSYEFIFIDFEFRPRDGLEGNPLEVICMVSKNLCTGEYKKLWADQLFTMVDHPFGHDPRIVLVAYYASAEMACFRSLGWNWTNNILDLFVEFRNNTNGREVPLGKSLLAAMKSYGLNTIGSEHKDAMRSLALRGGPYSVDEQVSLLQYCQSDVDSLEQLFRAMAPKLDLPRALLRGQYAVPLAQMEGYGSPIDYATYLELCETWDDIKLELINQIDKDFGVYENGSFREVRLEKYLATHNIHWERHPSGRLKLDEETFKLMVSIHPQLLPLRQLRDSLSKLRLNALQVGVDGRNRCLISPYSSTTGRNQPSTNKFVFGLAKWARGLIQPHPGTAVAYIDWSQQEFGVAAALSGDQNMMAAYRSGDPYLSFAKQAGAVPESATKQSHPLQRDQYKQCVLATQYGMGAESLAFKLGEPLIRAKQLLDAHRKVYKKFWNWSDDFYNRSVNGNYAHTIYGWNLHVKPDVNPRSLRNFPMQANSAEMLRIACILIANEGVTLCAPVHDAILIEAPEEFIEDHVRIAQHCMIQASSFILNGFELSSEAEIFRYPQRFLDKSAEEFWNLVISIKDKVKARRGEHIDTNVLTNCTPVHSYISNVFI